MTVANITKANKSQTANSRTLTTAKVRFFVFIYIDHAYLSLKRIYGLTRAFKNSTI